MNLLKKAFLSLSIGLLAFHTPAFAAQSILPEFTDDGCDESSSLWPFWETLFQDQDALKEYLDTASKSDIENILACAMRVGYIQFWMIPYFIAFALEFLIEVTGLLIVLMILIGAYYYIAGGVSEDKEKGKKIITYALGGFILALTSWIIVNLVLLFLTT